MPRKRNERSDGEERDCQQLESAHLSKLRAVRSRYLQAAGNYRRLKSEVDQGLENDSAIRQEAAFLLGRARRAEVIALEEYVRAITAYKNVLLKVLAPAEGVPSL